MGTQYPELAAALAAPFSPREVRQRTVGGGKSIDYITARTVMNRLDSVLGFENWRDEYVPGENSVLCRLTIRLPDGSSLTKADAGGYAGMPDSGDDDKSGYADAFKRAAVKFGVGRYLYKDGVVDYRGQMQPTEANQDSTHEETPQRPQERPARRDDRSTKQSADDAPRETPEPSRPTQSVPRSGRQLFAWIKEQEQRHEVGLLKYLNGWAKLQDFPGRIVDWDADQVAYAHAEAVRKLSTITSTNSEAYEDALVN